MSNGNATLRYTPGGADDPNNLFHYMPSIAATIVALILYAISSSVLIIWTIWKRSWYMIPLLIGCLMEIIGYATRIPLAIQPTGQRSLYICMTTCIIIAPVFYAAIEYVLYGRLVHAVGDQYSLIKPKLVARIFVISDVISFLVQIVGAGTLSSANADANKAKLGEDILLVGLAINLASFAIFCLQIFYFDYRTRKSPPTFPSGGLCEKGWRQFLYIIYISTVSVLIRQIYRVIEFALGFNGYLAVHEIYFYIFDSIPIFIAATIYAIFFPGNGYLPRNRDNTFITMMNGQQIIKQSQKNGRIAPQEDINVDSKL